MYDLLHSLQCIIDTLQFYPPGVYMLHNFKCTATSVIKLYQRSQSIQLLTGNKVTVIK